MATLRPSIHSTGSYYRSHSPRPRKDTLQPQWQETRPRSRSREPRTEPQPYDPNSPRRYRPNEKRSRKPPTSPIIEDGGFGDDGVRMRGKLEQQPMIIPVDSKGETLLVQTPPITPPCSDSDVDNKHVRRVRPGEKHGMLPNGHNARGPSTASCQSTGQISREASRGRRDVPKLDFSLPRENLPQLERARSPYASSPRQPTSPTQHRSPRESVLSPRSLAPSAPRPEAHRSYSHRPSVPRPKEGDNGSGSDRGGHDISKPPRPLLDRRVSAMPQLERTTTSLSASQIRRGPSSDSSSEDSERGYARHRANTAQPSPESKAKTATSYFDSHRPVVRSHTSKNTKSPPRTPAAAEHLKWGQSLNREALLNVSAVLLGASSLSDSNQRKASPRPSPQASPSQSPYPSPPRTPPEPHHLRKDPVSYLRHDSPKSTSRPSSPLSSGPPSPRLSENNHMLQPIEQDVKPSRYKPRSRATSPLPATRRPEPEPPKIDVRSPSPLPTMQQRLPLREAPEGRMEGRTPTRYMPAYAAGPMLQPARPDRRQRSLSNAESRGSRPTNLSINPPPVVHQLDVEYLSPSSENTPAHFQPSSQHAARPSLLSPTLSDERARHGEAAHAPSAHRSRSSVPTPNPPSPQSNSAFPPLANRPRSRSTAPAPQLALSDQTNPGGLPLCPRPDPVAGYNDWYTFDGCDYFAICPDCRHGIFGSGYERFFKLRSSKYQGRKTHCQLNDPWVRMACITSINSKQLDVRLLMDLANVSEDYDACPGPKAVERDWYRVEDEDATEDDHLADFQVCAHCVHSIEVLLPALKGTFFRYKGHKVDDVPRPCSLRCDNARFGHYIDKCDQAAREATRTRKDPDMSDFVWFHKKETVISECTRDQVLIGRDWHLNALIPEFAVCEHCYYDTVRPAVAKNYNLAKTVSRVPKHISDGISCQLYSARMKEIFERACREDDEQYLREAVLMRRKLQVEILAARMAVQHNPRDKEAQKELDELSDNWTRLEKKRH